MKKKIAARMHEEADDQPAEHAQDRQRFGAADPAAVSMEGDIQALIKTMGVVSRLTPSNGSRIPSRAIADNSTASRRGWRNR